MNIAIMSRAFSPSVGGLEAMMEMLADAAHHLGHEVTVMTAVPSNRDDDASYRILRRPGLGAMTSILRTVDVVLHGGLSLNWLLPSFACRGPIVVSHQTWLVDPRGGLQLVGELKRLCTRFVTNIAASGAIAAHLPARTLHIPNAYRDDIFTLRNEGPRGKDVVFVGRLVSDKGVDVLLEAIASVRRRGMPISAAIVGDGPDRAKLEQMAARLELGPDTEFLGVRSGEALAGSLNDARIMAIPSRWPEPFGIVALEGIACGCAVIGSADGGLPEAMGPCGLVFPNGDANRLADRIIEVLSSPGKIHEMQSAAPAHLARHKRHVVASEYLRVMEELVRGS